ncbi:MAG: hypothetical protein COS22_01145 [Candidatus Huberarchaeum crystalense]|uniref:Uncharacterized protein n=1 Tax=Huberarchaeum crystalense TaxID=2014257 RepID=A0A2H9M7L2_HUBC1|nr:MAG: hypothetical protein COS22_01145 [Candidatus Huberarchaeum crystalense]
MKIQQNVNNLDYFFFRVYIFCKLKVNWFALSLKTYLFTKYCVFSLSKESCLCLFSYFFVNFTNILQQHNKQQYFLFAFILCLFKKETHFE